MAPLHWYIHLFGMVSNPHRSGSGWHLQLLCSFHFSCGRQIGERMLPGLLNHSCPVSCFFRECWRQKLSYSHRKGCQPTDMRWGDNASPGWGVGGEEHGTEDGVTRQGWSCSCDPKLNTRNLGSPAGLNFKLAALGPAWFCPLCLPHHQN